MPCRLVKECPRGTHLRKPKQPLGTRARRSAQRAVMLSENIHTSTLSTNRNHMPMHAYVLPGTACCRQLTAWPACAGFAEQNAADLAKLKSRTTTFRDASKRKRLQALEALTREHRAMQTRMWFLQSDTKRGTAVKFDKTGQALLQLLRHLKRVSEVRLPRTVSFRCPVSGREFTRPPDSATRMSCAE